MRSIQEALAFEETCAQYLHERYYAPLSLTRDFCANSGLVDLGAIRDEFLAQFPEFQFNVSIQ